MIDNADIAAAREVVDRYAGTGRVLTHTIVHPNAGPDELERMGEWSSRLRPAGWKVYTLWDPPGSPTGGWYLDDDLGAAFLDRVRELGPRRLGFELDALALGDLRVRDHRAAVRVMERVDREDPVAHAVRARVRVLQDEVRRRA